MANFNARRDIKINEQIIFEQSGGTEDLGGVVALQEALERLGEMLANARSRGELAEADYAAAQRELICAQQQLPADDREEQRALQAALTRIGKILPGTLAISANVATILGSFGA
ncbi:MULTISPECIES: hypothetical protein [unclassified Solwaraspora]|mgnify:CR=1 FL=1|uniref:hypothetical protein n=1 Tax=unclassified Solwaraspora TaxID=2627926 RepID=UPI00248C464B|nr:MULTISPECIES: hypothetical protein [unclassified Solwaraspora]WBB95943.1 hypothetical protein O7553_21680 [Solwaraspora sp. WMMA2059]WBC20152.1 hypothetical protein O7543_25695 [Solwaraspora sp. WMMA2080]WJK32261.1 hypothetical protein O7610_15870 [Solwaraspora sp. WMMA2065]